MACNWLIMISSLSPKIVRIGCNAYFLSRFQVYGLMYDPIGIGSDANEIIMRPGFWCCSNWRSGLLNRIKSSHFTRSPFSSWHISIETAMALLTVDTMEAIPFYTVLEPFLASNAAVELFQFTPQNLNAQ